MTADGLHLKAGGPSATAERRRVEMIPRLVAAAKSMLGQFMTPEPLARFIASFFGEPEQDTIELLDPGAGVGSLTAAFVQRLCGMERKPTKVNVTAYEIDSELTDQLRFTLEECVTAAEGSGIQLSYRLEPEDFIFAATASLSDSLFSESPRYTHVIMNPPYRKINTGSIYRRLLSGAGIEVTNLYAAFVSLAVAMLSDRGQIVAITPRSFCNGPYFRHFRSLLLGRTSLDAFHVFESRGAAFRDDQVLQENVIFRATRAPQAPTVRLTSSREPGALAVARMAEFREIVHSGDDDLVIHLPVSEEDARISAALEGLTSTLRQLGIDVSTGPVVDFRLRPYLHMTPVANAAPLIYSAHFDRRSVTWPGRNARKPNSIDICGATQKWLMPRGWYTLTRRFSSKEEKRRIVAAVLNPTSLRSEWIGFENHLNVFHRGGMGLPRNLAQGLSVYLNSTLTDRYFRLLNGHTQVNATDLRAMPYPSLAQLLDLGKSVARVRSPSQETIDGILDRVLRSR